MNQVISSKIPTARKEHACDLCCGIITIGEKYVKKFIVGDWVGDWKEHTYCSDLAIELNMYEDREGISPCEFWEDIEVHLNKYNIEYKDSNDALRIIVKKLLNIDI